MSAPTIEEAIEALRRLEPERQQALAGYILALTTDEGDYETIDPADLPSVLEGLAQLRSGQLATVEEVENAFHDFDA